MNGGQTLERNEETFRRLAEWVVKMVKDYTKPETEGNNRDNGIPRYIQVYLWVKWTVPCFVINSFVK